MLNFDSPLYILDSRCLFDIYFANIFSQFLAYIFIIFFFLSLFIFRESEREQELGRDREGETIQSRLHAVSAEPNEGLELTNHEIMT